jgi:nucleoside-diphosphate kinase
MRERCRSSKSKQLIACRLLLIARQRYRWREYPEEVRSGMKTLQRTLAIIKPDAVGRKVTGEIINTILQNGFSIIGMKMLHLTRRQAEGFYAVHTGKAFFEPLTQFMSTGPCIVMALEKEGDAIAAWRKLMGATNPANAEEGTIRKRFAENIERNAVHGSDAEETARFEISYFFAGYELAR